jgi:hypothetical protein
MKTAVEWFVNELKSSRKKHLGYKNIDIDFKDKIEQAKEIENKQRQEDTNNGYSQGYDDGVQGKEPMKPETINLEKQSYQDKMRDKITKAKSRLK